MNFLKEIKFSNKHECKCGDTAYFDNLWFDKFNDNEGRLYIQYWCSHRCDSIITKTIDIKIKD